MALVHMAGYCTAINLLCGAKEREQLLERKGRRDSENRQWMSEVTNTTFLFRDLAAVQLLIRQACHTKIWHNRSMGEYLSLVSSGNTLGTLDLDIRSKAFVTGPYQGSKVLNVFAEADTPFTKYGEYFTFLRTLPKGLCDTKKLSKGWKWIVLVSIIVRRILIPYEKSITSSKNMPQKCIRQMISFNCFHNKPIEPTLHTHPSASFDTCKYSHFGRRNMPEMANVFAQKFLGDSSPPPPGCNDPQHWETEQRLTNLVESK